MAGEPFDPDAYIASKTAASFDPDEYIRQKTAPPADAGSGLLADFNNQRMAAGQGVSPHISEHAPNFISDQLFQGDSGALEYRDPATGRMIETDQNKHVVLRDPADNKLKLFARTEATNENPLASAGRLFISGAAAGAPTRLPSLVSTTRAPMGSVLTAVAKADYRHPEFTGLELPPTLMQNWSNIARHDLTAEGLGGQLADKTWKTLNALENIPEGATFTGHDLNTMGKTLGNIAKETQPLTFKPTPDAAAAMQAKTSLFDFVKTLQPQDVVAGDVPTALARLERANSNYGAAQRAALVDTRAQQAEIRALRNNSGLNYENTLRGKLENIVTDPRLNRGWTAPEKAQAREVVAGTLPQNTLRFAGNYLGGGGGLGALASTYAGGAVLGPFGHALPAIGLGMKMLGNRLAAGKVDALSEALRSRSALAEEMRTAGPRLEYPLAGRPPRIGPAGSVLGLPMDDRDRLARQLIQMEAR
jgi:hypothetical protein